MLSRISRFRSIRTKAYNKYVSPTGNDSNSGDNLNNAWATMSRVVTYINTLPSGANVKVLVKSGTYKGLIINANNFTSLTKVRIDFEANSTIAYVSGGVNGGIQLNGGENLQVTVNGNRLVIRDYTATSGNGLAMTTTYTTALLDVSDVDVQNCVDGVSLHGNAIGIFRNCTFSGNSKGAFSHVGNSKGYHYNCTFNGASGASNGIGYNQSPLGSYFEGCKFVPFVSGQTLASYKCTFKNCQVGKLDSRVGLFANVGFGDFGTFEDCYINASMDLWQYFSFTRCFGRFSGRCRGDDAATPKSLIKNCVFVGSATGLTRGLTWSNTYTAGDYDGRPVIIKDSVIMNYNKAIGETYDANQISFFNATSRVDYCNLYNNTTDIIAGITSTSNLIDVNPVLAGDYANSMVQADYAVTASACIGTGSDGGNIGI